MARNNKHCGHAGDNVESAPAHPIMLISLDYPFTPIVFIAMAWYLVARIASRIK